MSITICGAFKNFINRGNVIDLVVGYVVGNAFTAIITSIINDLIMPVISLITKKNINNLFIVLHCSSDSTMHCETGYNHKYTTILQANTDGAATWNFGVCLQYIFNFFIISIIMFIIVQIYSKILFKSKSTTKECPWCLEQCNVKSFKCKSCCSLLPFTR